MNRKRAYDSVFVTLQKSGDERWRTQIVTIDNGVIIEVKLFHCDLFFKVSTALTPHDKKESTYFKLTSLSQHETDL